MIVVRITINAISGKTWEFGTPDVRGIEANTAAAKPRGNITVIKVSYVLKSDLKVAILITINRIPRKMKDKTRPIRTDVRDEKLNNRPVNTKKNERIKKLI
jgi:hypothetical protein